MPRFVLLYHDCPPHCVRASHWDLMLESGATLRTWALDKLPHAWQAAHARTVENYPHCRALADGNEVAADQLGDHRRDYLEYEGELSGDRGRVIRVGAGSYETIEETPDCWQFSLVGDDASGQFQLCRLDADESRSQLAQISS